MMQLLVILFFLTRFLNLSAVPILNDEGIYLYWGNQFFTKDVPIKFNFIASDGKQPAVPFLFGIVQKLPFDPLISGRMVVGLFSVVAFISILAVQRKLFPKSPPWSLALMLIFCPYPALF